MNELKDATNIQIVWKKQKACTNKKYFKILK